MITVVIAKTTTKITLVVVAVVVVVVVIVPNNNDKTVVVLITNYPGSRCRRIAALVIVLNRPRHAAATAAALSLGNRYDYNGVVRYVCPTLQYCLTVNFSRLYICLKIHLLFGIKSYFYNLKNMYFKNP